MRAVNLMPADSPGGRTSRRSASGSAPHGAYFVLGILGALVVFMALWTVTNKQIDSRTAKLDKANAEAQAAETRADAAAPYQEFAALARDRKATVTSLSATRFDWAHGLREVSRVVPKDVWLSSVIGSSGASDAAPTPTTSAAPSPRFEMKGCTTSQANVARLMARLRAVDGVRNVELKSSAKPDDAGATAGAATGGGGSEDCPANKPSDPVFTIIISFAVPGQKKAEVDSTGQIKTAAPAPAPAAKSDAAGTQDPATTKTGAPG